MIGSFLVKNTVTHERYSFINMIAYVTRFKSGIEGQVGIKGQRKN